MSDAIPEIDLYTDGACKGNPGNGGWACILKAQDGTETVLSGGMPDTTNNQMELMAAIEGLKALKEPCNVNLTTDSKYVMDGITSWIDNWKKNNWKNAAKKEVKNKDLWIELDKFRLQHNVEWHWVKGHSGHEKNEIADLLANKGIDNI